ncbi:MAG: hypothetical protein WKG01_36215, partial [Kofleriaceae bacterium]
MSDLSIPCVLVVADADRVGELAGILSEPLPSPVVSRVEVASSTGGDSTIDLAEAKRPHVVVVTASLEAGDATSLVETLRGMMPRAEVAVVLVGDDRGPIKTVLDAGELAPDRFVARPISPRALRFAVASALEAVLQVRAAGVDLSAPRTVPNQIDDDPTTSNRAEQRRRWSTLADSIIEGVTDDEDDIVDVTDSAVPIDEPTLPPPLIIRPRRQSADDGAPPGPWDEPEAPTREPTLILRDPPDESGAPPDLWNGTPQSRLPGQATAPVPVAPAAPPTLPPLPPRTRTGPRDNSVAMTERREDDDRWSEPMPLAELLDREPAPSVAEQDAAAARDELDELADDLDVGAARQEPRLEVLDDLPDSGPPAPSQSLGEGRDFARQL